LIAEMRAFVDPPFLTYTKRFSSSADVYRWAKI
jgi:hypothetical protein